MVTLDGGKLVHVQKWDGKETTLVREVNDNSLTLVSIVCNALKVSASLVGNRIISGQQELNMFCCSFSN